MPNILSTGYGDTLRGDDASEYAYRDDLDIRVIASDQPTPEMSDDLTKAAFALFLDAAATGIPGQIAETQLCANEEGVWFTDRCTPHGCCGPRKSCTVLRHSRSVSR